MREQGYGSMCGVGRLTRLAVLVVLAGLFVFSAGGAWADNVEIPAADLNNRSTFPSYNSGDTITIIGDDSLDSGGWSHLNSSTWSVSRSATRFFELVLNDATTDIPENALLLNGAITGLTGNKVVNVGNSAFYYCASLKTVSLPEAVTINDFAFSNCASLSTLALNDDAPLLGVNAVFGNVPGPLAVWTEPTGVGNGYDDKNWPDNTSESVITNGFYLNPTITFTPPNPSITGIVGSAIKPLTIDVTPGGGAAIIDSDISYPILPVGLKVSWFAGGVITDSIITILGTPEAAGSGKVQFGVTNAAGHTASVDITYDIAAPADPGNNDGGGNNEPPGGSTPDPAYHKSPDITGLSVSIGGADYAATLQPDGTTWVIEVPYDTDLSSVTPDISLHPGAKLDPEPPYDFTDGPVTVTVTARDGTTTKEFTLIVGRAEPPAIPTNILDALPANATASVVPNADGTYGIEVRIPFGANFDPSEVEWIAIEAEGFSGLRVWYTDASGNETELTLSAATRGAAAYQLKIAGTAPNRESAERAKIVKVTVKKKGDVEKYYQNLGLKLADTSGWSLPAEETNGDQPEVSAEETDGDGGGSSSGGCDAGIPAGLVLCGTMLLLGGKRRR